MLGINHQSPLIHFSASITSRAPAGNQSPIPFDTLMFTISYDSVCWESITNPL